MVRKSLWAVLVAGLMMIVAPFALGLPSKASAGQKMMDGFRPIMQPANVEKTASYYDDTFVPLGQVVPALSKENIAKFNGYVHGFTAMGVDAQNLVPTLAQAMNMTAAQVQDFMVAQFPAMSQMLQALPTMEKDFMDLMGLMEQNVAIFEQVPGGLAHYKPLVTTMQANVDNYRRADSLPNMNLFTWFFVVPGVLLVGLAWLGLAGTRKSERRPTTKATPVPARDAERVPVSSAL
ncbi:MAG: hypothetical protein ACOYXM_08040 [Actinomycetota bacterium]